MIQFSPVQLILGQWFQTACSSSASKRHVEVEIGFGTNTARSNGGSIEKFALRVHF